MAKSFDQLVRRSTTKRTRQRAAKQTQELLAELPVSQLRLVLGKSQRELAAMLGIKQPSIAKLEKQSDMQISTLRKIVHALGGKLDVVARFPKGAIRIADLGKPAQRPPRSRSAPAEMQLF